MRNKSRLRILTILTALLGSSIGPALADEKTSINQVELGLGYVSEDAWRFGEYSGLNEMGTFIISNIDLFHRSAPDDLDRTYWELRGGNLGTQSQWLALEFGREGQFNLDLSFERIPKFLEDTARTPFSLSQEGTHFTLPSGWAPSDRDPSALTELEKILKDISLEHSRERYSAGLSLFPKKNWSFHTSATTELKDGRGSMGAIFGTNGGNPGATILPYPKDYRTNTFETAVGYAGKELQFEASYYLSLFENELTSVTFDNMYSSTRWSPSDVSYPDGKGRISLLPDNRAHRLRLSGSYKIDDTTRATADLSWLRVTQDEPFLDYTVNPALTITSPLPRSSLDGKVDTLTGNLALSFRPLDKLRMRASYHYEDRNNQTPRNVFVGLHNDSEHQSTMSSSSARINVPYSRTQHLAKLTARYRLSREVRLSGNYSYEETSRDFSDVETLREHKLEGKIGFRPSDNLTGRIGMTFSTRNGSEYVGNAHYVASHTLAYLGPNPTSQFENHPLIRKSYLADRDKLQFNGGASWTASDEVTVTFSGGYGFDDYSKTRIGLSESEQYNATLDAAWNPSPSLTANAWISYDGRQWEQTGLSSRPGTDLHDFSGRGWTIDTDDRAWSTGLSVQWEAVKEVLDVKMDLSHLDAVTSQKSTAGSLLAATPLPDLETRLTELRLQTDWHRSDQLTWRFLYVWQDLSTDDFALDGVKVDSIDRVVGLGTQAPDHDVHMVGVSVVRKF